MKFLVALLALTMGLEASANTLVNRKTNESITSICRDYDENNECVAYNVSTNTSTSPTILYKGNIHKFRKYSKFKKDIFKYYEVYAMEVFDTTFFAALVLTPIALTVGASVDVARLPYTLTRNAIVTLVNKKRDWAINFLLKDKSDEKVISDKMFKELHAFLRRH